MTLDLSYRTLANGLRVVLHRDPHVPLLSTTIAYKVGSRDETPGRTGFAHLFEHLMFDGSEHVPRGAYDHLCEQAGGQNNAYTSEDNTCYYTVLPSHQRDLALWLESDRLAGLLLTPEGLETQRSVVLEEKRQRVDNQPYGSFDHRMVEMLFPGHPYGHSVLGSTEDLTAATMDDVVDFHRTFYRPDNAVLVVAGDIDTDETFAAVEKYFGAIPRGGNSRVPQPAALPLPGERRLVVPDAVPLPAVFFGFRTPPERDDRFIALDLLSDILGSGESSRLYQSLIYTQHCANQASAWVDGRDGEGMFVAYAMAVPGTTAGELESALDAELCRIACDGVSAAEMEKTRNRAETAFYQSLQTISLRADRLSHYALFYDDPGLIHGILDRYRRCSADDIRSAAELYLARERRVVLHFIPQQADGACDTVPATPFPDSEIP